MILQMAAMAARRRAAQIVMKPQQRKMGTHAPAPEWEGIDKVVRGYFPKDYQLAMAIMGGYFGLFCLFKIKGAMSGKKVEAPAPVASTVVVATTGIPSVDTPEFDKYLETDAFYKMLENEEQLSKVVEDMK